MKKTYLILVIFFSLTKLNAQDFAPIGAKWHYTTLWSFTGDIGFYKIESVSDTIIKGKTCRVLQRNGGPACTFGSDFVYTEDSVIYFYVPEIDSFQILFDLKAKKDSSWIVIFKIPLLTKLDTLLINVDSVSSININTVDLIKLHVTYHSLNYGYENRSYKGEIIERIGDINYMFNFASLSGLFCDLDFSGGLRCYEDSQLGFHSTGIADSCTYTFDWTSVNDIFSITSFTIFPNPADKFIEIRVDFTKLITLEIRDILGQLLLSTNFTADTKMNIASLPKGLYVLSLKHESKILGIKKLMKR